MRSAGLSRFSTLASGRSLQRGPPASAQAGLHCTFSTLVSDSLQLALSRVLKMELSGGFSRNRTHEQRLAPEEGQGLEVGDGAGDGSGGARHGGQDLPLPLAHQVGWAEDQHPPEAGQAGGRGGDSGLAGPHLAYEVGAPMPLEREGHGPNGVALGAEGPTAEPTQVEAPSVTIAGRVERRVRAQHCSRDSLLEGPDELRKVQEEALPCGDIVMGVSFLPRNGWHGSQKWPRSILVRRKHYVTLT